MNRKILQAGPATLAVSLPREWVKRFSLKKGQELVVELHANSLLIKTKSEIKEDNSTINISALHPISTKLIGMLYKAGYKRIKAVYTPNKSVIHRSKSVKEIDMIRNTFDHLIGMQLWDLGNQKGEYYAVAVESAKVDPKEFDHVFNRLYLHLIHQAEQVYDALAHNKDIFDEAYLAERLINQTADFCTKIVISFGHEDYKKTIHYYDFISKLESVGDKYFHIVEYYHKNRRKVDKNIIDCLKQSMSLIKESVSLYRKFDYQKIILLTREIDSNLKEYENRIQSGTIRGTLFSYYAYSILAEIYEIVEILFFLNNECFKNNF